MSQESDMRQIALITIVVVISAIAACVPSLQPLYSAKVLTFEPALIGTWISEDSKDTSIISQSGDSVYDIVYSQEGVPAKFEGHLARLNNKLFLDTYPEDLEIKNDFYKTHLIPAHMFSEIEINGDTLQFAVLDDQWLGDQLDSGSVNIGQVRIEGDIVLTASTDDLQNFVAKCSDNEDAFPNPAVYHRLP